ncbi:hypothetical protein PVAND_001763 [Polypedilum vanderplanki]|uniref:Glycerol kinase n=1 Tax=Polypedilum vanderplanki TaxID=319348 RepID=A0A9J6BP65_POLVA|nr:hypothetical protein PVAND_001763 [Polypedilum vanderplanki]
MTAKKFGKLIGVIEVSISQCKFLIYALKNSEILTEHEIKINKVDNSDEEEYDPVELWNAVQEVIDVVIGNLKILEIDTNDICAIGITNQRETSLLWDKKGEVFNFLCWADQRLIPLKNSILRSTRNKQNYLRNICGLPFDICFSAIKIKWLIENNKAVRDSIRKKECFFGNLDSWIIWNLTGKKEHVTDVSNASRTLLMNLETLNWDSKLCNFFNVPISILPKIKSNSEIFGYIKNSTILEGIPIASSLSTQSSAMIGQMCLNAGQIECHIDNDCSVMLNTGEEIIHSENGLLTTVGFQLGPKICYALEGFIGNSCSSFDWLKNTILPSESNNNFSDDNISPVSSFIGMRNENCFKKVREEEVVFVSANKGLCAPNFLFQAKGFLSGISINTTTQQIFTAAKESICFQTKSILDSIRKDCKTWPSFNKLVVGGEFSENVDFLQLLADLCWIPIERPQISAPVPLGAMLSAAITMKCISLEDFKTTSTCVPPIDSFNPTINSDMSDERYVKWLSAFKTSLCVNEEKKRVDEVNTLLETKTAQQFIMNSLPGCLYLFTSYVIYVLSQELMNNIYGKKNEQSFSLFVSLSSSAVERSNNEAIMENLKNSKEKAILRLLSTFLWKKTNY